MKKLLSLLTALALMLTLAGCGDKAPVEEAVEAKTTEGRSFAYGGEIVLNVTTKGDKLEKIEVVSNHETTPLFNRAFPVLVDRIMTANSPVVDNVTGATFMSNAVKKIVAETMDANCGTNFGTNLTPAPVEKKQLENVTTDLVIVGAGPAGLSAALSAKENGIDNIIVIEKMDILSGNGKFDRNYFDHYNTDAAKADNADMTKEEYIAKKAKYEPIEKATKWAEVGYGLDEWLRSFGITLDYHFGSGTSHMAPNHAYAGDHIQTHLEEAINKYGIEVRTATKGLDLIMNDGVACGVKCENREGFYDINAKAVIVATGGYANSTELINKYAPEFSGWMNTNQIGATGDFVSVFEKNDCKLENMETVYHNNNVLFPTRHLTGGAKAYVRVNEDGTLAAKSGNSIDFLITDEKGVASDDSYRMDKHVKLGYYTEGATLEELATKLGIKYDTLVETIKTYNEAQAAKNKSQLDLDSKFYGAKVTRAIHTCPGGVVTTANSEVVKNNDEIVKGLYAAGEVTAQSGDFQQSTVFGKVAGEEAAKLILGK